MAQCVEMMHLLGRLTSEERNMHIVSAYVRAHRHAMTHFEDLVQRFTDTAPHNRASDNTAGEVATREAQDAPAGDDNGVALTTSATGTGSPGSNIHLHDPHNVGATCVAEKEAIAMKALKSLRKTHERL